MWQLWLRPAAEVRMEGIACSRLDGLLADVVR
jgi:hypothetical protein